MTDQRWIRIKQHLQTYPCTFCGAQPGQPCVVTANDPHTKHGAGKPTNMPHAARYTLDRKTNPPYGRLSQL